MLTALIWIDMFIDISMQICGQGKVYLSEELIVDTILILKSVI